MKRLMLITALILLPLVCGGCKSGTDWLSIFDWSKDSNGEYTGQ